MIFFSTFDKPLFRSEVGNIHLGNLYLQYFQLSLDCFALCDKKAEMGKQMDAVSEDNMENHS